MTLPWSKLFVIRMLRRDLFAVTNLVVLNYQRSDKTSKLYSEIYKQDMSIHIVCQYRDYHSNKLFF